MATCASEALTTNPRGLLTHGEESEPRSSVEDATPLIQTPPIEETEHSYEHYTINPMYIGLGKWSRASHTLASVITLILFVIALSSPEWRVIDVDREKLLDAADEDDDYDVLMAMDNQTMYFSRRMGIYQECLISAWNDSDVNITLPSCRNLDFLPAAGHHESAYYQLIRLFQASMMIGPLVAFISLVCVILHCRCYLVKERPLMTALSTLIHLLLFNCLLGLAFLIVVVCIDAAFTRDDPGYPSPWPEILRRNSKMNQKQFSMVFFILGMITQVIILNIDIVIARRYIHLTRSRTRKWYTWFLR